MDAEGVGAGHAPPLTRALALLRSEQTLLHVSERKRKPQEPCSRPLPGRPPQGWEGPGEFQSRCPRAHRPGQGWLGPGPDSHAGGRSRRDPGPSPPAPRCSTAQRPLSSITAHQAQVRGRVPALASPTLPGRATQRKPQLSWSRARAGGRRRFDQRRGHPQWVLLTGTPGPGVHEPGAQLPRSEQPGACIHRHPWGSPTPPDPAPPSWQKPAPGTSMRRGIRVQHVCLH